MFVGVWHFYNLNQAQYATDYTCQDVLVHFPRVRGLKFVSINLAIMLDVGVIVETNAHAMKAWEEVLGIDESAFHALMKSLINGQM